MSLSRRVLLRGCGFAFVAGFAGCLDGNPTGNQSTRTSSASDSNTDDNATSATTVRQSQSTAEPLPYDSLSPAEREVFTDALHSDGTTETDSTELSGRFLSSPPTRVEYQGQVYAVSASPGSMRAEYDTSVREVETPADDDEVRVVAYETLSEAERDAFDAMRRDGTLHTDSYPFEECRPDSCYVRYDGSYYAFQTAVSDIRVWQITVEQTNG